MKSWMFFSVHRLRGWGLAGLLMLLLPAWAGPGAHGPNGEHLDAADSTGVGIGLPRIEAHSESFELVGQLHAQELSLLIDRYQSNEPVLGAQVEVESGGLKAVAKFHVDQGDYAVDDPPLLALLRQPGEHALVFTIVQGADSDLLDGMLRHPAAVAVADDHDAGWAGRLGLVAAIGLGVLTAGAVWWMRRRSPAALPKLGEPA